MKLPILGVDISKEWFDVDVLGTSIRGRFAYDEKGIQKLLKCLKKHRLGRVRVCMEATGLYYEKLAERLHEQGHEVVVVNPQCVKAYACSKLRRSKTDPLDAALCGKYCEVHYDELHLWLPMPEVQKHVRETLRRRQSLVEQRTAEKNRLQAGFSCHRTIESIIRTIQFLDDEISRLEQFAFEIIDNDPEFRELIELADTIKGISKLTAAIVLVEVPKVLWNGKLAAAFAGLIPRSVSSGKSKSRSYLTRVGNKHVRCALYMPAMSAIQHNPLLKEFYARLVNRGLAKKQALSAVMRKLLVLIFGVLKTGKAFDAQHELKRRVARFAA